MEGRKEPLLGLFKVYGRLNGGTVDVLIDNGSTCDFISSTLVSKMKLKTSTIDTTTVKMPNGTIETQDKIFYRVPLEIGPYFGKLDLSLLPLQGYDIILGQP